jgi:hypothetical protein
MISVSRGASRTVLLVGRWAVKVPRLRAGYKAFLCGMLSNMAERDRWRVARQPGLCPVLWSLPFGLCVVMPRVRLVDRTTDTTELAGLTGYDHKASSYGYHRGELVAIDYHGDVYKEAA